MTNNKNFLITSVIFNEIEDVTDQIFGEEYENFHHIAYNLAEKELDQNEDEFENENEYSEAILEVMNNIITINRINTNGILFHALLRYFNKDQTSNINGYKHLFYEKVRSCVFEGDYMYYVTGCGYDTISSDLLGTLADGTEKNNFIEWLNN